MVILLVIDLAHERYRTPFKPVTNKQLIIVEIDQARAVVGLFDLARNYHVLLLTCPSTFWSPTHGVSEITDPGKCPRLSGSRLLLDAFSVIVRSVRITCSPSQIQILTRSCTGSPFGWLPINPMVTGGFLFILSVFDQVIKGQIADQRTMLN